MILVQDKLVSDDILEEKFICNLEKCKGACCWEGDLGAPLEKDELKILKDIYIQVRPFLTKEGQEVLDTEGVYKFYKSEQEYGTPLIENAACAYMTLDKKGVAQCGIEQAWKAGATDFRKPISCHLYPIRIKKNEIAGFEALNYDRWDICSAACTLGEEHQVSVYEFLKEAIIRKYGEAFYEELDAAAQYVKSKKQTNI
jgi:Protein of unknown function (DUF3109)